MCLVYRSMLLLIKIQIFFFFCFSIYIKSLKLFCDRVKNIEIISKYIYIYSIHFVHLDLWCSSVSWINIKYKNFNNTFFYYSHFDDYQNKIWYQEIMMCDVSVYFSDCDAKSDKSISNNNAKSFISKSTQNIGRSSR
jgi:hypothetical protein